MAGGQDPYRERFVPGLYVELMFRRGLAFGYVVGRDAEPAVLFRHDLTANVAFTCHVHNLGRGDPVLAEGNDFSGTNNANMRTPAEGASPRMQVFVFPGTDPDRTSNLEALIVIHELGHYVSNRLIGNANGLTGGRDRPVRPGGESFRGLPASHVCTCWTDREVVMIIGAAVIAGAALLCTCTVVALRRRGRSRG
ncbi:M36 family metallopeptidase [Spirillospora sp. CA-294931]|uniref:M36 family metallopeptidase n=1 Tax=Spirillospora sp. CA-294931 TaxID=3240042 RepID=UPI003D90E80B